MSDKENQSVNLVNCDFTSKGKRVNTPRSIEACNLTGVNPDELHKISLETYIKRHPECKNLPKELIQERYDNYEKVRKELIENALKIRNQIVAKNPEDTHKKEDEFMNKEEVDKKDAPKLEENEEKKEENNEEKKEENNEENKEKNNEENKEKEDNIKLSKQSSEEAKNIFEKFEKDTYKVRETNQNLKRIKTDLETQKEQDENRKKLEGDEEINIKKKENERYNDLDKKDNNNNSKILFEKIDFSNAKKLPRMKTKEEKIKEIPSDIKIKKETNKNTITERIKK